MGKIKINLVSGTTLEKPLISCFKGTNANYIVLDNESNGSMGLPIIIISKLNGTNLEKIIDPNEWGAVKENLRTIISGTALPYLAVPETLSAPDDFFTQLTLPVASYDLLKSVYAPPVEPAPAAAPQEPAAPAPAQAPAPEVPATPAIETPAEITLAPIPDVTTPAPAPVAAPVEAPVVNPAPAPAEAPASVPVDTPVPVEPVTSEPASAVEAPVETVPATPAPVQAPVVEPVEVQAPTSVQAPVAAVAPATPTTQAPTVDVASGQAPAIDLPQSQPAETVSSDDDISKIKETFMKSCENMFDALMQKFQNK